VKLYDYDGAPNPRRVKIFAAEKGIDLELIHCDMAAGEHKTQAFLQKNPSGKIPVLELDDGRCIPESVAICRYLEAIEPEPNLFGRDPFELGFIEARNRQIEMEYWREVSISWVNGPIVGRLGLVRQVPEAKEISDEKVNLYYARLNNEFSNAAYVAGDRFTVADISLLTGVDFAASLVGLTPDESFSDLYRWYNEVSERPSCASSRASVGVSE